MYAVDGMILKGCEVLFMMFNVLLYVYTIAGLEKGPISKATKP